METFLKPGNLEVSDEYTINIPPKHPIHKILLISDDKGCSIFDKTIKQNSKKQLHT